MRGRSIVALASIVAVAALTGCGGSKKTAVPPPATTSTPASTTRAAAPFRVTIEAPTHHPKANAKWPVTITVADAAGKPIAATLRMWILVAGSQVGQVDNGRVYHFVGSWKEQPGQEITWPAASAGVPVTFPGGGHRPGDDTPRQLRDPGPLTGPHAARSLGRLPEVTRVHRDDHQHGAEGKHGAAHRFPCLAGGW